MTASPEQTPDPQFLALYEGRVLDNADPKGQGRIRAIIPGIFEEDSPWMYPIGSPGGGQTELGFFFPPRVGANVAVFFKGGDTDYPRYLIGTWAYPSGVTDIPRFARFDPQDDTTPITDEERYLVNGIETERWQIIMDNRDGRQSLIIRDKNGLPDPNNEGGFIRDEIEIDGANRGIRIQAVAGLSIKCVGSISIDAPNIRINGRRVENSSRTI